MDPGYCHCNVCAYIDRRHNGLDIKAPEVGRSKLVEEILSRPVQ